MLLAVHSESESEALAKSSEDLDDSRSLKRSSLRVNTYQPSPRLPGLRLRRQAPEALEAEEVALEVQEVALEELVLVLGALAALGAL